MQLSHRPLSPSRSNTPSRITQQNPFLIKAQLISKSPIKKQFYDNSKQSNQYLNNHLQRKCTSPIKSPLRSPSPLVRKNTYEYSNNRSPMKLFAGLNIMDQYNQNRMPESCYLPSSFIDSTEAKQNSKSNAPMPLFTAVIRDQNIKSQNCKIYLNKKQSKQGLSFMSLIKKQNSLGLNSNINKQNQQSYTNDKISMKTSGRASDKPIDKADKAFEKGSITTTDLSSGKKMSFKDSFKNKQRSSEVLESMHHPKVVLQKSNYMLDSVGTISGNDRVNESIAEESFMDLNMDPCFDM